MARTGISTPFTTTIFTEIIPINLKFNTKSSYSLETGKVTSNYKQWVTIVRYGDKLSTKELKKLKDKVKSRIKIGDKVYIIKYKYSGIAYTTFTICCTLTNKVVENNMFQTIMVYSKSE